MAQKRVHILSAVNTGAVSKSGGIYTIRDVCGAVDGLVMNRMLYPADQLAAGAATLNHKPAPAGHPKDAEGRFISASSGDALLTCYAGAVCRNARHQAGRTLVDIVVNEQQARANPDGAKMVERLDAALNGSNVDPIHVSTGLVCEPITANGESGGKAYDRIATRIQYDHLAILLNDRGAGTPADGVGMFLNGDGSTDEVEAVEVNAETQDKRSVGRLMKWLHKLVGNGSAEVSFDQITSGLYALMPDGSWLRDVFDRYAVWSDRDGKLWRQDYSVASDGSVAFSGTAVEVRREVTYEPVTNRQGDPVKDLIINVLKTAGIAVDGKTDDQLLRDFEALKLQPVQSQLTAANSKIAGFEAEARRVEEAEVTELATSLAVNSSLTVDDLKKLGAARLRELKAAGKAAPVVAGGGQQQTNAAGELAGYDLNKIEA